MDSVTGKLAAAVAMVACCGLSMAIALGLVAFSSTFLIGGVALAVAVGCVVFMVVFGHGRHRHGRHDHGDRTAPEADEPTMSEPGSRR